MRYKMQLNTFDLLQQVSPILISMEPQLILHQDGDYQDQDPIMAQNVGDTIKVII